jgi:hypothetical protein
MAALARCAAADSWKYLLFAGLGRFVFNLKKVLHE